MYLSFHHVQHDNQLLQSFLQLLQPLISMILRNRLYPLRRSRGAQHHSPLQLVTLDVLGIMAGFVSLPLAFWRFTGQGILLEILTAVSVRMRAQGILVLGWRQSIWKERATVE